MLTTATKRKIDTARDILVGKIPMPTSQVEQITLALIYKFMSDMDKKAKDLGDTSGFFANGYEKFSWDKLMDKALPARDRVLLYREALEKMALNPHIPQLFRDVFRNASLPFNDPETLKLFLDVIDQFEYDHSEELGNAFEYLLQIMGSQGDAGQFRTPRHIIDFIVAVVDPQKTDRILDPACGTAGFLISAYNHLREKGLTSDEMTKLSENFVGYDISQDMQRLSLVNMYLHHFPDPHIYEYDTLSSEERWNDDFDVILANPPFMTPKGGIRPHNRFSVPSKRAEVLFVDYIMEHLTTRGKAGVIVPEGIIFQSQNAYKQLRKMMVENDYLWAVVSLPSGVFQPYSGVKTSVLLFDKEIAKKSNKILFVKVENDGYDLGAQRREIDKNDLPVAQKLLLKYKQAVLNGQELNVDDVIDLGGSTSDKKMMSSYGFDLDANSHIELSQIINKAYHEVEKKSIKQSDFVLNSEQYQVSKFSSASEYETIALGEVCDIVNGSTPSRSDESFWSNGTIPWFTIQDIRKQGRQISHTKEKITGEALERTSVRLLPKDSVLLCCTASVGEYAYAEIPLTTNQQFNGLIVKKDYKGKLLPKFLFWISSTFKEELERLSGKTSFNFVSVAILKKISIPLPPISVQQEIVAELDRYQKIIDGARQVVNNYLPEITIDQSWNYVKIGEAFEIKSGGTPTKSKSDYWKGDIPWYSSGELNDIYTTEPNETITGEGLQNSSAQVFPKGSLLIGMYDTAAFKMSILDRDAAFNQAICGIKPNPKYNLYFIMLYLLMNKNEYLKHRVGVRQRNLNKGFISQIEVPNIAIQLQDEIVKEAEILQEMINSNIKLVRFYESKIDSKINDLWGNNFSDEI